jgi:chromosomal replication initiation ATPase DnaA
VTQSVQDWLLTRLPRSPTALLQAVVRLDRASLAFGKAITRSLATKVLVDGELSGADADEISMSGIDPSSQPPSFL